MNMPTTRRWTFRLAVVVVALAVVGAAALAWWHIEGTGRQAERQAAANAAGYLASCGSDAQGDAVGVLTLPGGNGWIVRPGADASLDGAIGWYQQTAGPGQVGNMAVVGQRLTAGGPFDSILTIEAGDTVTLETCADIFTYTVRVAPRDLTVQAADVWVLDAVPGQPGTVPTSAWLTLIANHDIKPSSSRAVGFAELTATVPR